MVRLEEVVYVSRAAQPPTAQGLRHIVDTARMLNRRRDLTGVLACSGSHYLQVLEGGAPALDALLLALQGDPRHAGMQVLRRAPIVARRFGDWAMALVSSPDLGERIAALADPVADPAEMAARLDAVLPGLLRHLARRDDGADSRYAPF